MSKIKKQGVWIENNDPLECGVMLPLAVVNAWKKERVIKDWIAGGALRDIATRYSISHQTVKEWTQTMVRHIGAGRRPKRTMDSNKERQMPHV